MARRSYKTPYGKPIKRKKVVPHPPSPYIWVVLSKQDVIVASKEQKSSRAEHLVNLILGRMREKNFPQVIRDMYFAEALPLIPAESSIARADTRYKSLAIIGKKHADGSYQLREPEYKLLPR